MRLPLPAPDDALRASKAELLSSLFPAEPSLDTASGCQSALSAARVLCLTEDEAAFLTGKEDFRSELNPRNEAAALSLLYCELRSAGLCPLAQINTLCLPLCQQNYCK